MCIGNKSFYNCSGFYELNMKENLIYINDSAFFGCSGFNGNLIIPSTVTFIGPNSFYKCSGFNNLILSNNLIIISKEAFQYCVNLKGSLIIPNSVRIIDKNSFSGCSGFTENLELPLSIEKIGSYAFSSTNFKNIFYKGDHEPNCSRDIGFAHDKIIYVYNNYTSNSFCYYNVINLDPVNSPSQSFSPSPSPSPSLSPEKNKIKLKPYQIVLIGVASIALIIFIVIVVCCIYRRRRNQQPGINPVKVNLIN